MVRTPTLLLLVALVVSACTTSPIPAGYQGPVAHIRDSVTSRSGTSADFFYVAEVNGRRIDESLAETQQANYGRGVQMTPRVIGRDVPAEPSTVKIVGRTH